MYKVTSAAHMLYDNADYLEYKNFTKSIFKQYDNLAISLECARLSKKQAKYILLNKYGLNERRA